MLLIWQEILQIKGLEKTVKACVIPLKCSCAKGLVPRRWCKTLAGGSGSLESVLECGVRTLAPLCVSHMRFLALFLSLSLIPSYHTYFPTIHSLPCISTMMFNRDLSPKWWDQATIDWNHKPKFFPPLNCLSQGLSQRWAVEYTQTILDYTMDNKSNYRCP